MSDTQLLAACQAILNATATAYITEPATVVLSDIRDVQAGRVQGFLPAPLSIAGLDAEYLWEHLQRYTDAAIGFVRTLSKATKDEKIKLVMDAAKSAYDAAAKALDVPAVPEWLEVSLEEMLWDSLKPRLEVAVRGALSFWDQQASALPQLTVSVA